jgi:hypothetical protein
MAITSGKMESTFVMEGNVERFKEPESEEAQIPVKARDVFFSKIILTGPAIHAAPYLVGVVFFYRNKAVEE